MVFKKGCSKLNSNSLFLTITSSHTTDF